MILKYLVIIVAGAILFYFGYQAFQGDMSSGEAIKEFFL